MAAYRIMGAIVVATKIKQNIDDECPSQHVKEIKP